MADGSWGLLKGSWGGAGIMKTLEAVLTAKKKTPQSRHQKVGQFWLQLQTLGSWGAGYLGSL